MNCGNSDLNEFIFIPSFIRFAGEDELKKLVCFQFMALHRSLNLVEHCSANAKAISSHPVQKPKTFFGLKIS